MEGNQKITCTVESCLYNDDCKYCALKEIKVTPIKNCATKKPDESMCSSYKFAK